MGTLFLRSFDLLLHSRTILKCGNNKAGSLPQNRDTTKLICVVDEVCMIKARSQECLSLALLFLPVLNIVRLWKQMGKCVEFNPNLSFRLIESLLIV